MGEATIALRALDDLPARDAQCFPRGPARPLSIAGGPQRVADAMKHRAEVLDELPLPMRELLLLPLQGLPITGQGAERFDEPIDHGLVPPLWLLCAAQVYPHGAALTTKLTR